MSQPQPDRRKWVGEGRGAIFGHCASQQLNTFFVFELQLKIDMEFGYGRMVVTVTGWVPSFELAGSLVVYKCNE